MAEYRSPSGEVLDIPAGGVGAIRALGWEPVEKQKPVKSEKEPVKRAPSKQSTQE